MVSVVRRVNRHFHPVSFFSSLIDKCFSTTNPSYSLKFIHAQLIKHGFSSNTFLGNRCIDLYLKFGSANDALNAFHDMPGKNIVSWNLYLKLLVNSFDIETARHLFDEMPERDAVSWNTIISGYISSGFWDRAWEIFFKMQNNGVKPSEFTFSMLFSCVKCTNYAKEMHGSVMRNGVGDCNLVIGNSLIDVYGKLGLVDYALAVFFTMERVDVISWNSLISGCCNTDYEEFALRQFCLMGSMGYKPDEYTLSSVLAACSNLQNLEKGNQILCLCIKTGILSNTIVSSAAIDLFSKCNRMESATRLFEESCKFDSALSNSMIACYASHGLEESALKLFVFTLKENIRPTEFTLSSVVCSASVFLPEEHGSQLHSLIIKSGFELDAIVASSLVEMYSKYGLIDFALDIFVNMCIKDLIAWNTMILGLVHNGKVVESICLFEELLESGLRPDHITFADILLACSYGGLLEKGMAIFSSMEKQYGVKPTNEHYAYVVDMMCRAGKIKEAIDLLNSMRCAASAVMWESILCACMDCGNLKLIETFAERVLELDPRASLPFSILVNAYEQRGRWESLVRVKKEMKRMARKEEVGCSWICIKNRVFSFEANQMIHHGGKAIYSILGSLMQEVLFEINASQLISDQGLENG